MDKPRSGLSWALLAGGRALFALTIVGALVGLVEAGALECEKSLYRTFTPVLCQADVYSCRVGSNKCFDGAALPPRRARAGTTPARGAATCLAQR